MSEKRESSSIPAPSVFSSNVLGDNEKPRTGDAKRYESSDALVHIQVVHVKGVVRKTRGLRMFWEGTPLNNHFPDLTRERCWTWPGTVRPHVHYEDRNYGVRS